MKTTLYQGHDYFLDDIPVREATVLRGHAVRALYLSSGAVDVATETGDTVLMNAIQRQWANTVAHRTYITGGMGAHHQNEEFGDDYELPADRAYAETCASIGSVMLSWRLLLQTGEPKYADLIERTLLNGMLVSPVRTGAPSITRTPCISAPSVRRMRTKSSASAQRRACVHRGSRCRAAPQMLRARSRALRRTSPPRQMPEFSCTSTCRWSLKPRWATERP